MWSIFINLKYFFFRVGEKKSRVRGYVEEVVPAYTDEDFRRIFRMNRTTFSFLLEHLETLPELQPLGHGRRDPISIQKQLLITLWYVGGTDPQRKIADRFGVSESTAVVCRDKIISALIGMRQNIIRWPNAQELQTEEQLFQRRNGFPGIVGAIDGTHIQIKAPRDHPQSYVNRKHYHSLQLQCVCRHNRLFSHVFTGYPGSVHDSRVLQLSDLWESCPDKCGRNYHILGDGGYPLRKWLLTPYRDNGHLTPEQKKYNTYHSSNRVVIERAFALLKGRFRRLHYLDTASISTAVDIIVACCVLHNFCILEYDVLEENIEQDLEGDVENANVHNDQNRDGIDKRNVIARNLL